MSQELVIGAPRGPVKANEVWKKGSDDERWNIDAVAAIKGLPWQPDPTTAGHEVKSQVIAPIIRPPADGDQLGIRPIAARGVAVKRSKYLVMGPAPGRYGCRALVRADAAHGPRSAERGLSG